MRTLCLTVFVLLTSITYAQLAKFEIGPESGLNISVPVNSFTGNTNKIYPAFLSGLKIRYSAKKNLGFRTGIYYERTSYAYNCGCFNLQSPEHRIPDYNKKTIDLVYIPAMLDVHTKGKLQFGLNVGVFAGVLFNSRFINNEDAIKLIAKSKAPAVFKVGGIIKTGLRYVITPQIIMSTELSMLALPQSKPKPFYNSYNSNHNKETVLMPSVNLGIAYVLATGKKPH